jgi:hypothetical protein
MKLIKNLKYTMINAVLRFVVDQNLAYIDNYVRARVWLLVKKGWEVERRPVAGPLTDMPKPWIGWR